MCFSALSLPIELWLQIFRWATLDPWTHALYATEYKPFETTDANIANTVGSATKRALVLVCKQWRRWSLPLLYEDILIPGAHPSFEAVLREGEDLHDGTVIPPCAKHVRRALLPYSSTITSTPLAPHALDVIELCKSLQVLVRSADLNCPTSYEFETNCPDFPSLKRLDWWHLNEAARTGGINSLADVLKVAPNLEYLSVGGEIWPSYLSTPNVHLPRLTTLRFRRVNAFFVLKLCRWQLPALAHLVFDQFQNPEAYWPLWEAYGSQVRSVEFGLSLKFYVIDFLAYVFAGCPGLEELNCYAHFTHPPPTTRTMEKLHTVGMHAHPNSFYPERSEEYWAHLERHFAAWSEPAFPALKNIMLYGDWEAVVADKEFERITKPLREKGCNIEVAAMEW